ncbi:MAG: hypothetical protein IJU29_03480 [Oscillospiraceae bacterium]|nr:hypothetical protein [Oscillospiraceae bacterium]
MLARAFEETGVCHRLIIIVDAQTVLRAFEFKNIVLAKYPADLVLNVHLFQQLDHQQIGHQRPFCQWVFPLKGKRVPVLAKLKLHRAAKAWMPLDHRSGFPRRVRTDGQGILWHFLAPCVRVYSKNDYKCFFEKKQAVLSRNPEMHRYPSDDSISSDEKARETACFDRFCSFYTICSG